MNIIYFLRSNCKKIVYYEIVPKTGECFEERLRGGKSVKNLKIIWMDNKIINCWIRFSYDMKNQANLGG